MKKRVASSVGVAVTAGKRKRRVSGGPSLASEIEKAMADAGENARRRGAGVDEQRAAMADARKAVMARA